MEEPPSQLPLTFTAVFDLSFASPLRFQKLRMVPSNVDEFVDLMSALTETQDVIESLNERREFVSDLYMLLAEQVKLLQLQSTL